MQVQVTSKLTHTYTCTFSLKKYKKYKYKYLHPSSATNRHNNRWAVMEGEGVTTSSAHPSNSLTLFWKKISVSMISERMGNRNFANRNFANRTFGSLSFIHSPIGKCPLYFRQFILLTFANCHIFTELSPVDPSDIRQ